MIRSNEAPVPLIHHEDLISENSLLKRENIFLTEKLTKERQENADLREKVKRLETLALKDPLTELYNRRGFLELLESRLPVPNDRRSEKMPKSIAILMLDIDYFKKINDQFEHAGGDEVLKTVALELKKMARKRDIVSRWGGEEFAIAFIGASAQDIINKFYRKETGNSGISIPVTIEGSSVQITLSGGISELSGSTEETIEEVMKQADRALYAAKEKGRSIILNGDAHLLVRSGK